MSRGSRSSEPEAHHKPRYFEWVANISGASLAQGLWVGNTPSAITRTCSQVWAHPTTTTTIWRYPTLETAAWGDFLPMFTPSYVTSPAVQAPGLAISSALFAFIILCCAGYSVSIDCSWCHNNPSARSLVSGFGNGSRPTAKGEIRATSTLFSRFDSNLKLVTHAIHCYFQQLLSHIPTLDLSREIFPTILRYAHRTKIAIG